MTIIGGTYKEIDEFLGEEVIYGSGVRALEVMLELSRGNIDEISFHSCCDTWQDIIKIRYAHFKEKIKWHFNRSYDVTFYYTHAFNLSGIIPRPDCFLKNNRNIINVEDANVLLFGMLDADFKVQASKVVYDPQSVVNPILYSQSGSKAESLAYVLNTHEAKSITGQDELMSQAQYLFEHENCKCVIIKCGTQGAFVFDGSIENRTQIPVYKTNQVHSIGSGDVFSATFAYYWFCGYSVKDSAEKASMAVACYADKGGLSGLADQLEQFAYGSIISTKKGKVYLAGPFFSYSQRWLINQFYNALCQENIEVFSPLHNVGLGGVETTALDLEGLQAANVVLAVADGLDAGTMFEVGYARKSDLPIVVFNSCETKENLQMLVGSGCDVETDFTTAIYKTIWYAIK